MFGREINKRLRLIEKRAPNITESPIYLMESHLTQTYQNCKVPQNSYIFKTLILGEKTCHKLLTYHYIHGPSNDVSDLQLSPTPEWSSGKA